MVFSALRHGVVTDLDNSLLTIHEDSTTSWITYQTGTDLDLLEGEYQIALTVGNATYLSHRLLLCNDVKDCELELAISCAGSKFSFTMSDIYGEFEVGVSRSISVDIGDSNGWQVIGGGSGMLDHSDIQYTISGQGEVLIRATVSKNKGGCTKYYKLVVLDTDDLDPCDSFEFYPYLGEVNNDRSHCLTFYNGTDLFQGAILYQFGYVQKFYFRSHIDFPEPSVQDNFIDNGEGGITLRSFRTSEIIKKEFGPIPDYLHQVLQSVRAHSSIVIKDICHGAADTVNDYEFSVQTVDNDPAAVGTIEYHRNLVYQGVNENIEGVSEV
jgi:hypothetical protein